MNDQNAWNEEAEAIPTPNDEAWSQDVINSSNWSHLWQRFAACNPLLLASALLMIYGLFSVSTDPGLMRNDIAVLAFNFTSLQLYEVVCVLGAIALLRRAIRYDGALLIVLEHVFLLVPFMTISQATVIDQRSAIAFGVAASAFVLLRGLLFDAPNTSFRFHPAALAVLGAVLVVNFWMPIHFRALIENDSLAWTELSPDLWLYGLPALILLSLILPAKRRPNDDDALSSAWFQTALFGLWFCATGVHLRSIDYLDNQSLSWALTAPALLAAAWCLLLRIPCFPAWFKNRFETAAVVLTFLIPALGSQGESPWLAFCLFGINAVAFFALALSRNLPALPSGMALASAMVAAAFVPGEWLSDLPREMDRLTWLASVAASGIVLVSMTRRRPAYAFASAIWLGIAMGRQFGVSLESTVFCLQASLFFFLVHSQFWTQADKRRYAAVRIAFAAGWIALGWLAVELAASRGWMLYLPAWVSLSGELLLMSWVIAYRDQDWVGGAVIPFAGFASAMTPVVDPWISVLLGVPAGYWLVAASFATLALGIFAGLNKCRNSGWNFIRETNFDKS